MRRGRPTTGWGRALALALVVLTAGAPASGAQPPPPDPGAPTPSGVPETPTPSGVPETPTPSGVLETPPSTVGGLPAGSGRGAPDAIVPLAPITRAFGRRPYADATAAAAAHAGAWRGQGCALSGPKLAAIMLAITFTEAGPLASTTVAPSPMTLSRWDGSGILYAFGNPTADRFRNAFWHPGIGLWQFDHPWQNTAAERINTNSAAQLAAEVVAGRFCRWTPATGLNRLAYAVAPWHGCTDARGRGERCREIFLNHYRDNDPRRLDDDSLARFTLVDGVSRVGGAVWRTCQLVGAATTVDCMFVDPAAAQGSRAWASPGFSPNPLSAPFYVVRTGGAERRFWLREDTGYSVDVDAAATIGSNPRSTLRWSSGAKLCDRTARKGACDLRPPSWKSLQLRQVSGSYRPVTGDFDGDGRSDIFWYGPGAHPDSIWFGRGPGAFSSIARPVSGTYEPFTGDFDGDGRTDVFWYAPGPHPDSVWFSDGDGTFTPSTFAVDGDYQVVVADFDGDGGDELLWYAPGSPVGSPDRHWRWSRGRRVSVVDRPITGTYTPLTGDFDGDGRADLFLYGAEGRPDHLWYGTPSGAFVATAVSVRGTYRPFVGDFDGDGVDDVFWYAPGGPADSVWYGERGRGFASVARQVAGHYRPVVGDISGNGTTDIVWYAPGVAGDTIWRGTASRVFATDPVVINGDYARLIGDFDGAGGDDVFWYRPGPRHDALWY